MPYLNGLTGDFIWDDLAIIPANQDLTLSNIPSFFSTPFLSYYRPLVFTTFSIEKALSGGPFLFHLTNILLHVLATGLTFLLARHLLPSRIAGMGAFVAAGLFSLLPVHSEAVTWIAGRGDLLMTCMSFGSLLAYIRWREGGAGRGALITSFVLLQLGLLSKETAAVVPLLWAGYEWTRTKNTPSGPAKQPGKVIGVGFLLTAGFFLVRSQIVGTTIPDISHVWTHSLTFVSMLPKYVAWTILPLELNAYRMTALVESPIDMGFVLGCGLIAGSIYLAKTIKTTRFPLFLFYASLLPVSNIIPLGPRTTAEEVPYLAAERWLYLPSIGICLLMALGLAVLWDRWAKHRRFIAAGVILLGLVYTVQVLSRNVDWGSEAKFYSRHIALNPDSVILPFNDGNRILKQAEALPKDQRKGLLDLAEKRFMAASQETPKGLFPPALYQLGRTRFLQGKAAAAVKPLETFIESWTGGPRLREDAIRLLDLAKKESSGAARTTPGSD